MLSMIHRSLYKGTINLGIPSFLIYESLFLLVPVSIFWRIILMSIVQVDEGGGKEIRQKMVDGDLSLYSTEPAADVG